MPSIFRTREPSLVSSKKRRPQRRLTQKIKAPLLAVVFEREFSSTSKSITRSEDGRSGFATGPVPAHQTRNAKGLPLSG